METRQVDKIKFRDDLYPRFKHDPALVQKYAQDLELLPPIEINQHDELIDGFHRWTAYKTNEVQDIPVIITQTVSEVELLRLAIQANSKHGWQLNEKDKKSAAVRLYASATGLTKDEIAVDLSVSARTVRGYLSDIDKQVRQQQKQQVFDLYISCHTQQEISDILNIPQKTISRMIESFSQNGSVADLAKSLAFDKDQDFTPPLYNIWNFSKLSNNVQHFGNSEQRIIDNLLYLYTNPLDIVVDPFAGGGSTIDVCLKRLRRYYVSDRKPIPARADQIRRLDAVESLPDLGNRWNDVSLTYLDPPYWRQAFNKYSQDAEDLANMSLEDFTDNLVKVVEGIGQKQSKGAIALLIQPTMYAGVDNKPTADHVIDLCCAVNLDLKARISCPYSTEQYNGTQAEWAKENKKLLGLTRELIIWSCT